ncbi:hypothetical protein TNCV_2452601 [Trichonephila clavipes]|nr:hypothetical protein TNCV_2452601 [Trichonephila clavipes]
MASPPRCLQRETRGNDAEEAGSAEETDPQRQRVAATHDISRKCPFDPNDFTVLTPSTVSNVMRPPLLNTLLNKKTKKKK